MDKKANTYILNTLQALEKGSPQPVLTALGRDGLRQLVHGVYTQQGEMLRSNPDAKLASEAQEGILAAISMNPPASVLLICLRKLFPGDEFIGWEPETIALELEDLGADIDEVFMDKLNALLALVRQPTFFNNVHVYENTVRAFSNLDVDVSILQKTDTCFHCVAMTEVAMIANREQSLPADLDFVDEIKAYVGAMLAEEHYVIAPEELSFCQEYLDDYNENKDVISAAISSEWDKAKRRLEDGDALEDILVEDSLVNIQIRKLAGCWLFVKEKIENIQQMQTSLF